VLQEVKHPPAPGLVKLTSMSSLRLYLKDLMIQYEQECDRYGDKVSRLMRILETQMNGKEVKKLREVEWRRLGMVMANFDEPVRATLELMIEAMEDFKAKAKRTEEVLAKISELENLEFPEGAAILVYLRHGVPLRIVVDGKRLAEVDALVPVTA
jgi:hypothetical protein